MIWGCLYFSFVLACKRLVSWGKKEFMLHTLEKCIHHWLNYFLLGYVIYGIKSLETLSLLRDKKKRETMYIKIHHTEYYASVASSVNYCRKSVHFFHIDKTSEVKLYRCRKSCIYSAPSCSNTWRLWNMYLAEFLHSSDLMPMATKCHFHHFCNEALMQSGIFYRYRYLLQFEQCQYFLKLLFCLNSYVSQLHRCHVSKYSSDLTSIGFPLHLYISLKEWDLTLNWIS